MIAWRGQNAPATSFWRDQTGAAAVLIAIVLPILIGFVAVGAEIGYWYLKQRKIQHIADVTVYSAVLRHKAGDTTAQVNAAVMNNALASGFDTTDMTMTINTPPISGAYTGGEGFAEVTITQTLPRYFSAVFTTEDVTVNAPCGCWSWGGYPVCMLALSPTASGAITAGGSSVAVFEGCSVASNSAASDGFLMNGGSVEVTAGCVDTVGDVSVTAGLSLTGCVEPRTMQPPVSDPYANLTVPVVTGTPVALSEIKDMTFTPVETHPLGLPLARFTGGLSLRGNANLDPGLYIIDGGTLDILANSVVTGSGVAFFLANGANLKVAGTATLNISARTVDPLAGLLFFSDPNGVGSSHTFSGNAASTVDGVIYFPNGNFTYTGNSGTASSCLQIVSEKVEMTGNSNIAMNCTPTGGKQILADQKIRLYE